LDEKLLTRSIMSHPVVTIARDASALDASELMARRRVLHLVVVDAKGHVVGVVSDRDVRSAQPSVLLVPDESMRRKALGVLRVEDVMTAHPATVRDDTPIEETLEQMLRQRIGCLPVLDRGGALVGIVTGGDVTRLAIELVRARVPGRAPRSR